MKHAALATLALAYWVVVGHGHTAATRLWAFTVPGASASSVASFVVDSALVVLDEFSNVDPFLGGEAGFVVWRDVTASEALDSEWEVDVFAQREFVLTVVVRGS